MAVFISHSHHDREFVDKLALNLVSARVNVWLDRWELKAGDSLIEKIEQGLEDASALIVVLSCHSVESAWCRKELSAGLIRELEERKVVVVPVVLDDCKVPLLLRDKLYADFRTSFDEGWHAILEATAGVSSLEMGRIEEDSYHMDWAERWGRMKGELEGQFFLQFTFVQFSQDWNYSILSEIFIVATEDSSARYTEYERAGLDWLGRFIILESVATLEGDEPMRVLLDGSFPKDSEFTVYDPKSGHGYVVRVTTQRLGEDHGKDILIDCSETLSIIHSQMKSRMRPLTADESTRLMKVVSSR